MLKITYTETGLHLEHLEQTLEEWIAVRAILAVRANHRLMVEHGTAAFLLPVNLPQLPVLQFTLQHCKTEAITLSLSDADYIEVTLQGTWVTFDRAASRYEVEGVFVTEIDDRLETLLFNLWQAAERQRSSIWR